jgi:hypothetical protein
VSAREKYQRKALAVARAAEGLHDAAERVDLLQVARGYLALARLAESRHDDTTAQWDEARPEEYRAD